MKNVIVLIIISSNVFYSQEKKESKVFTSTKISFFGGINFENFSDINEAFYFEGATNITQKLYTSFSLGYYKSVSSNNYTVNSFKYVNIDDYEKYHTITYEVIKTEYQVVPFTIGLQYYFKRNGLIPYLVFDFNYNLIDPLTFKTPELWVGTYETIEDIPMKYKSIIELPNSSLGLSLGLGIKYNLFSKFDFNFKYLYKIDNEILNTHQFLLGISI